MTDDKIITHRIAVVLARFQRVLGLKADIFPTKKIDTFPTDGMYGHHLQQNTDQPGNVTNSSRVQLNIKNVFSHVHIRA